MSGAFLQPLDRVRVQVENLLLPGRKLAAEILELTLVHERLIFGRTIVLGKKDLGLHSGSLLLTGQIGNETVN